MFTQVTICYEYPLSNVQVTGSGREQAVETLSTAQWQLQVLSQLDSSSLDFHFDFHSQFSHRNITIVLKAFVFLVMIFFKGNKNISPFCS